MPAPSAVISERHLHLPNPLQDNKTGTCRLQLTIWLC